MRPNTLVVSQTLAGFPLERLNAELAALGFTPAEDCTAAASVIAAKVRTLDEATAVLVNLNEGVVSAKSLTTVLAAMFPNNKVGERHGPHQLSHARTGKLTGEIALRFVPEKRVGAKVAEKPAKPAFNPYEAFPMSTLRTMMRSVKGTPTGEAVQAEIEKREAIEREAAKAAGE